MTNWLQQNYIEVIGATIGLVYLFLEIRQSIWLWPFGLVTSAIYIYIFFVSKFYADMGLQVYYVVISAYGWWHWLYGGKTEKADSLPVSRVSLRLSAWLLLISVGIFAVIAYVLINFTDSTVPYGDAFTTALSIIATWMLARKFLEMWWIWVVVNAVSLALYLYKGLYPTSVLFVFYTAMSFVGYLQWRKSMKETSDSKK
jgi:nicotinamide mononucleotide transporter